MSVWIPAIVAIISLIINIVFTFLISPHTIRKNEMKSKLFETCLSFLEYLSDVVSYSDFNGVPTKVRNFSLKIHLSFKTGTAPEEISNILEELFVLVKKRKNDSSVNVSEWEHEFRIKVREFRCSIAKYVGMFN